MERENINTAKHQENRILQSETFKGGIPQIVKEFGENYDFLVLYDEWRKKKLKLKCHSILDSLIVLPNGDVPICQNLDLKLGNLYESNLDEVFNSAASQDVQKDHVNNCNQCWINFHRKYDVVLYRTFEKYFGKGITSKVFGYYQWEENSKTTYSQYINRMERTYK